jgi:serine/threonine-protein kinase
MNIYCTRPDCPAPINNFTYPNEDAIVEMPQKYCSACTMPLVLNNRYLPERQLSRGAFGVIFLAQDRSTPSKRRCVIKQLHPKDDLTAEQLQGVKQSFKTEAAVLKKLGKHAQIPSFYAYFELKVNPSPSRQVHRSQEQQQEFFYLVQEYVNDQNLEEELEQKDRFSEKEVRKVLQEILPVLQFVHDNQAIHRDIKPANLMRAANGRIYLLDFGAVKQVKTGVPTQKSRVFGTPLFAPPEQVSGEQVYRSTDLYALAVTCIRLLTKCELDKMFEQGSKRWNWRHKVQVSDRLEGILDRMLLPDPKQRFQSANQVLTALLEKEETPVRGEVQLDRSPREADDGRAENSVVPKELANDKNKYNGEGNALGKREEPAPDTGIHKDQEYTPIWKLPTLKLIRPAVFTGSASWLLAITLISFFSFLGTVLISSGLWLLIWGAVIFANYRQNFLEKIYCFCISFITSSLILFWFQNSQILNHINIGWNGIVIAALTTILAGCLAFILISLSKILYQIIYNLF